MEYIMIDEDKFTTLAMPFIGTFDDQTVSKTGNTGKVILKIDLHGNFLKDQRIAVIDKQITRPKHGQTIVALEVAPINKVIIIKRWCDVKNYDISEVPITPIVFDEAYDRLKGSSNADSDKDISSNDVNPIEVMKKNGIDTSEIRRIIATSYDKDPISTTDKSEYDEINESASECIIHSIYNKQTPIEKLKKFADEINDLILEISDGKHNSLVPHVEDLVGLHIQMTETYVSIKNDIC